MRKANIILVALSILVMTINVFGEETEKETPKEFKNQTHCPVMGGKIDSTVYTDIQGHRVYHCCPMCTKKLVEDPDKYFEETYEKGILFENIQTTCPVSGKEIDKAKSPHADYKGRRVYFCCDGCMPEFAKKPAEYLDKLTVASSEKESGEKEPEKVDDKHEGHGH